MEMASSKVEISSCQTFNCVLTPHDRCTRGDNKNNQKNNNNNNNVRNIVPLEKNLNIFVRDNLENVSVSVEDCDDSTKSSVSAQRLSKTDESESDPRSSETGQPENSSRNEALAASSLVQIWEARTTQQTQSSNQNQFQIDSRTSSLGSILLESLNEETVKESDIIQPMEGEMECDSQFIPPLVSGEKEKEGVRVLDIIRKLSNDSETLTNHENGSSSYDSSKEVQPTEARCFPQVACSPRIRGRQAYTDLLVHMMRDREKELACILDRRSVSKFTHRGRIQSTLKIRCYERCIAIQDRCKSSSIGSNLNRSPQGSCVMQLLREKYKKNSEQIETGSFSSSVSSRGWLPEKDPHKATEKKVLQKPTENNKESQEMTVSTAKKAVLSESSLKKPAGETIKKELAKGRGENQEMKEKSAAKESLEGKGEKRELTKEKSITKEKVEGNAMVGIAEKVNLWNSEEKTRRREIEKGKIEGKGNTTKSEVLEEVTKRVINVESAERSNTTTSKETMKQCEFSEKLVRRKKKEACVESKPKEIEDTNINPSEEKTTEKSDLKKCTEKESRDGKGEKQVEENTFMGTAEKVNLWNSKEEKYRRRVMDQKGKSKTEGGKDSNTETNEVLREASRTISNVETAERNITSSKETMGKVVNTHEMMDKMEISRETTQAVEEANSKQIIENINTNTQDAPQEERPEIPRNSEAKSIKENDRNSSQEVIQKEESVSDGSRERDKDQNGIKEGGETKKVEFVSYWDENEMEEEEVYENTDDWIYEISRPRSYWEELRKERYLEVLNTESDKTDICNLIDRRTVSNFLTSDLRKKIDNLMISRVQGRVCVRINEEEEEEEKNKEEDEEEEWKAECSASNQEDNETEDEADNIYLEAASDIYSQSSARSSAMVSWSLRSQDIDKDQDLTASLSLPEPSVSTNHSMQELQMMSDLRGEMQQLQREMLELRNSVKSCIDMQIHFQKSITDQDLSRPGSSSEQRVDPKKDPLKRKCCICSEMPVDSLLYRCGHMCTCLKCAHELQWSSKKCPICMAPIVDVVRAFLDS